MKSTALVNAIARDLADKLAKRLANGAGLNTVRQAADANANPMLVLSHGGTETEASPVLAIRLSPIDAVSKDIFGNATSAYSPSNMEIAWEKDANGKPEVAAQDIATVMFEAIKCGVKIQLKEIANGTAVTEASLNAAAVETELDELYWPLKSI